MTRTLLVAIALAAAAAACTGSPSSATSTTAATTGDTRRTELFSGDLAAGSSQFYSFSGSSAGTTDITLVSLRPAGVVNSTLSNVVGIGVGTPAGTGCSLTRSLNAAPALSAQLSMPTTLSTYCVAITDVGFLSNTTSFAIRITHP